MIRGRFGVAGSAAFPIVDNLSSGRRNRPQDNRLCPTPRVLFRLRRCIPTESPQILRSTSFSNPLPVANFAAPAAQNICLPTDGLEERKLSMTQRVRLILTLHDHQPIGNFDGVFEASYRESYLPFLEVLERYADIPVVLHTSGSLLEWLVDRHPEYIERVRALVERDQVEVIGGPFFEPILASIPSRDRVGQIKAYTAYLEQLFGRRVRGMWVPERVWEQSFASDIVEAGIEYTLLDDYHFKNAGLRDDELHGYYLTEDEGRLLKVFPVCERLRYTIPFAEPHETINHLRWIAERHPGAVVAFGDDGEKFGSWPDTHKHVYENGWIHRFFRGVAAE